MPFKEKENYNRYKREYYQRRKTEFQDLQVLKGLLESLIKVRSGLMSMADFQRELELAVKVYGPKDEAQGQSYIQALQVEVVGQKMKVKVVE